ncbi:hypothetical protein HME01_32760 [Vreelandella aquamarina]|nr:hypothetical protein HME01_32760 [Halomonas meridiana]
MRLLTIPENLAIGWDAVSPNAEVTGAGAQRREPKAARFWGPVDRLVN